MYICFFLTLQNVVYIFQCLFMYLYVIFKNTCIVFLCVDNPYF